MSYTTEFDGDIVVHPRLPDGFITQWNEAKRGTPGKSYVRSARHDADGKLVVDEPDMLPGIDHSEKPQAWCHWKLEQSTIASMAEPVTLISWDGSVNFIGYEEWLQLFVDVIEREYGAHEYDGVLQWSGEDSCDVGYLLIERHSNRAEVTVKYGELGWLT